MNVHADHRVVLRIGMPYKEFKAQYDPRGWKVHTKKPSDLKHAREITARPCLFCFRRCHHDFKDCCTTTTSAYAESTHGIPARYKKEIIEQWVKTGKGLRLAATEEHELSHNATEVATCWPHVLG